MLGSISIPTKVTRIVPTLGSPVDGEALGACRAIGRVLDGAGLGFTDLADAIITDATGKLTALGPRPDRDDGWRRAWAENQAHGRRHTPRQEAAQRAQVRFCRERSADLTAREHAFVWGINVSRHGLTIRQADWLADIADRLDHEDHARSARV